MGTTTMGVKLDDATRERIKSAASRIDRTPHWLIKQAIFNYLEKLENDETLPELPDNHDFWRLSGRNIVRMPRSGRKAQIL